MKKLSMNINQWMSIGETTGWLKEAKFADLFRSPEEKAYLNSKKDRENQELSYVKNAAGYAQKMQMMQNLIQQVREGLSDKALLAYIQGFPDGNKVVAQLRNIEPLAKSFRVATQFVQSALQGTMAKGAPVLPEQIQQPSLQQLHDENPSGDLSPEEKAQMGLGTENPAPEPAHSVEEAAAPTKQPQQPAQFEKGDKATYTKGDKVFQVEVLGAPTISNGKTSVPVVDEKGNKFAPPIEKLVKTPQLENRKLQDFSKPIETSHYAKTLGVEFRA